MADEKRQDRPGRDLGLADALFPRTRSKVLGLLFGQPARGYPISELIELAAAGSGAIQREVQRLAASGLLTVRYAGRQKLYQANPDAPIYDELCSLVNKTLGPAAILRSALAGVDRPLELAILYGSVARGTDRADSDIDLLLVSDDLSLEDAFRLLAPTEGELGRRVNPTLYTREEFDRRRRADNPFLRRVLEGKHVVLQGDLDGSNTPG